MAGQTQTPDLKEQVPASRRHDALDPQRLLAVLPLRPYYTVADLRCGSGLLTIPLAKYLFDGRVYAVDPDPSHLEALRQRLEKLRLTNVEAVQVGEDRLEEALPREGLDGILSAFVLWAVQDRLAFLRSTLALLKKGGWLAVVEWRKKEGAEGPPMDLRLSEEEVQDVGRSAGYRFATARILDDHHSLVLLRK